MATFEYMGPRYASWLKIAQVKPEWQGAIDRAAKTLLAGKDRYQAIEKQTGVPWAWIAVAHYRECNGDFRGVLHNGQRIVGTGQRTTIVPAGRGPFATWEESALDAIAIMGWAKVNWTFEMMCYKWETFNGFGYANMGRPSPYVWSGTNIYVQGKYVSDGVYDPQAVDQQVGCVPIYLRLIELSGETKVREESTQLVLLDRVRLAAKGAIGGVAAWAGGVAATDTQSLFNIGAAIAIVGMAAIIWWLANKLDKMLLTAYKDGRYVPSGADPETPRPAPLPPVTEKEPAMNFALFMPLIAQVLQAVVTSIAQQQPGQPLPPPVVQPPIIPVPVVPLPQPPSDGTMERFLKNLMMAVLMAAANEVMKELPNLMAKSKA